MTFFRLLWVSIFLVGCIVFYTIFFSSTGLKEYVVRKQNCEKLSRQLKEVEKRNEELFKRIEQFKLSPEFREYIVREKLGWTRPNERIIVLVPEETYNRARNVNTGGGE